MLRVAVIADDPLTRAGLMALLEAERLIVAKVLSSVDATSERFLSLRVDVLLWAVEGERTLPLDLESPTLLVLPPGTESEDRWPVDDALPLGSEYRPVSVVSRAVDSGQLAAALAAVAAGLIVMEPEFAHRLSGEGPESGGFVPEAREAEANDLPLEPLSARELEVLRLLADGLSNKVIGKRLELSEHTVKFHLNSLFEKLAVHNRTEAVSRAVRLGLIAL